jgi:hypothetical protein
MGKRVKAVAVIFLMVVYCLSISAINHIPISPGAFTRGNNQKEYFSKVKAALNDHFSPGGSTVKARAKAGTSGFNPFFIGPLLSIRTSELLIEARGLQYKILSRGLLIRFRKADLIFPFHYFW